MIKPESAWKWPHPGVTVCMIAFDSSRRFPVVWRTDKVRSAKNQWSLPTGLHENGMTLAEQASVELMEEFSLTADPAEWKFVTTYENILPQDNFHWVISMGTIPVRSLGEIVNKEPDKHSEFKLIDPFEPGVENSIMGMCMGLPMREALAQSLPRIRANILNLFPQ